MTSDDVCMTPEKRSSAELADAFELIALFRHPGNATAVDLARPLLAEYDSEGLFELLILTAGLAGQYANLTGLEVTERDSDLDT